MISFISENVNNNIDSCATCIHFEKGDMAVGISDGCTHSVLYDEDDNIIDECNNAIIECMENPSNCTLYFKRV